MDSKLKLSSLNKSNDSESQRLKSISARITGWSLPDKMLYKACEAYLLLFKKYHKGTKVLPLEDALDLLAVAERAAQHENCEELAVNLVKALNGLDVVQGREAVSPRLLGLALNTVETMPISSLYFAVVAKRNLAAKPEVQEAYGAVLVSALEEVKRHWALKGHLPPRIQGLVSRILPDIDRHDPSLARKLTFDLLNTVYKAKSALNVMEIDPRRVLAYFSRTLTTFTNALPEETGICFQMSKGTNQALEIAKRLGLHASYRKGFADALEKMNPFTPNLGIELTDPSRPCGPSLKVRLCYGAVRFSQKAANNM